MFASAFADPTVHDKGNVSSPIYLVWVKLEEKLTGLLMSFDPGNIEGLQACLKIMSCAQGILTHWVLARQA